MLFVAGELDNVIRTNGGMEASTAALRLSCTDLRRVVFIKDCGHWNTQEKPEETNAALIQFLHATKDLSAGQNCHSCCHGSSVIPAREVEKQEC